MDSTRSNMDQLNDDRKSDSNWSSVKGISLDQMQVIQAGFLLLNAVFPWSSTEGFDMLWRAKS